MSLKRLLTLLGIVAVLITPLTTRNSGQLHVQEIEHNHIHQHAHNHVHDDNCNHEDELEQKNQLESYQRLNHGHYSKGDTANDETPITNEIVSEIEEELQEQGTSVLAELYRQYEYYLDELTSASGFDLDNLLLKVDKIEETIALYENKAFLLSPNSDLNDEDSITTYSTSSMAIFGISPDCTCNWLNYLLDSPCANCQIYSDTLTSVAAISALFSLRGWQLAADLIWFGRANTTLDCSYTPSQNLVNRVAESPQITEDLAGVDELAGGLIQSSPGRLNGLFVNTIEGDVFNSLGSFYFTKSYAGNNKVNVSILDRYDYARGGSSPGGVLIDIMVTAQEIGILVPFYTRMSMQVSGTAALSWEYTSSGILITGAPASNLNIVIPESLIDLRQNRMNLLSVYVTEIKINAFTNFSNLNTIHIPLSVLKIGANAFTNCSSLIIYTERISKPSEWDSSWNSSNRPVVWGGENRQLFDNDIVLSNYSYLSQYNNFTPISETIISQTGQQILTNRLRCGVIAYEGNSYLTLSAKNKDATMAYLEYYFSDYFLKIDYQLALWSASESLILNSSIRLEVLQNGEWAIVKIFSANNMSQSKDSLINYTTTLSTPSNAFRFIVETNQVSNDNNRGRVVIGNINVLQIKDPHIHNYTSIKKYNASYHKVICYCGEYILEPHLLIQIPFEIFGYNHLCLYCGEFVDVDEISQSNNPAT